MVAAGRAACKAPPLAALGGLRGAAAIWVACFHAYM
jgi:hypothetical protein